MLFNGKNCTKVAVYLRLSREDGDKAESDSVANQRALIQEYAKAHAELQLAEEYVDDGYSGTNFERPAFQQMLSDIKQKKMNCIIVKDLSRLGRNYIETGRYMERIFPFLGVRFISVTDHYDSIEEADGSDQIIIPFKNLINDAYCRDISTKIRSQLDVKRKNGLFIGSFAGYGYKKDPLNRNHIIVDEYAADVVRKIFGMRMDGYSSSYIANHLNAINVLPPLEYKRSCGLKYNSGFRTGEKPHWEAVSVIRILRNELYTGTMVQGKRKKVNYKIKKSKDVEESDWIRVEQTHTAIIPLEVFQNVQALLALDTRTPPEESSVAVLSGFVRCGDCGQNMVRRCSRKGEKCYYYFHCSTYKSGNGCSSHIMSESKLSQSILKTLQVQIGLLVKAEQLLEDAENAPCQGYAAKALDRQLGAQQAEIERYKELKAKLYTDMLDGVVEREEYRDINGRFSEKLERAKNAAAVLEKKRDERLSQKTVLSPWLKSIQQYQGIQKLERKLLVCLVDHVAVYGKDRIEVVFRHQDEMDVLLECLSEESSEIELREAEVSI